MSQYWNQYQPLTEGKDLLASVIEPAILEGMVR